MLTTFSLRTRSFAQPAYGGGGYAAPAPSYGGGGGYGGVRDCVHDANGPRPGVPCVLPISSPKTDHSFLLRGVTAAVAAATVAAAAATAVAVAMAVAVAEAARTTHRLPLMSSTPPSSPQPTRRRFRSTAVGMR